MTDLVSIITPSHNAAKYIAYTIASVQKQTHSYWELIIVDDFSNDNTVAVIETHVAIDDRIKLYKLNKNSGTGIARNTALQHACGKYIAFLDADDLWKPEKLEKQLHFLKSNHLQFTFSFYDCIDEEGNLLKKTVTAPRILTYKQLFYCNYVGNLTGIYNADFFGKIPISSIRKRQDWMLWLSILEKIKIGKPVPESLAFYRVRKNSISASKFDLLKHNFAVYRQHHGYNFIVSMLFMIGFLFTQLLIKPRYTKFW